MQYGQYARSQLVVKAQGPRRKDGGALSLQRGLGVLRHRPTNSVGPVAC